MLGIISLYSGSVVGGSASDVQFSVSRLQEGTPSLETFTLSLDGVKTSPIHVNASAGEVRKQENKVPLNLLIFDPKNYSLRKDKFIKSKMSLLFILFFFVTGLFTNLRANLCAGICDLLKMEFGNPYPPKNLKFLHVTLHVIV